jgi:hypothetical protein
VPSTESAEDGDRGSRREMNDGSPENQGWNRDADREHDFPLRGVNYSLCGSAW